MSMDYIVNQNGCMSLSGKVEPFGFPFIISYVGLDGLRALTKTRLTSRDERNWMIRNNDVCHLIDILNVFDEAIGLRPQKLDNWTYQLQCVCTSIQLGNDEDFHMYGGAERIEVVGSDYVLGLIDQEIRHRTDYILLSPCVLVNNMNFVDKPMHSLFLYIMERLCEALPDDELEYRAYFMNAVRNAKINLGWIEAYTMTL